MGFAGMPKENTKLSDPSMQLKQLVPDDIKSIEIFRLETENGETIRRYICKPLEQEIIQGILSLCKKATIYHRPEDLEPNLANKIMVVQLKKGGILEIPYSSYFYEPFGTLESQKLKEALYAITNGCRGSVIYFHEGKVLDVTTFDLGTARIAATSKWKASIDLDENGQVILSLLTRKNGKTIMQDEKPIRYGMAKTYDYEGDGYMIVHLYLPTSFD
jgi:hypothetical protein